MPSKRDSCLVASDLQTDYLARDVEELVSEIKENLRLKAKPVRTQAQRPSPYSRPARRPEPPAPTASSPLEDPYEMLQQLLQSNSLVAEAVRRLQEGLGPKQRFFYDDEDEVPLLNYPVGV